MKLEKNRINRTVGELKFGKLRNFKSLFLLFTLLCSGWILVPTIHGQEVRELIVVPVTSDFIQDMIKRSSSGKTGFDILANNTKLTLEEVQSVTQISPDVANAVRNLSGCTTNTLPRNDDASSEEIPLPFTINFFGRTFQTVYVNNNGNITFDGILGTFTPFALNTTNRAIVAPFFADVDTRNSASGVVQYGNTIVDGRQAFCVNYVNVGYYNTKADKLNTFQVIIIDRTNTGTGNFDIEFNYNQIQWETGDASGGTGGLGGNSARAGYANGNATPGTFFEIPGSAVNGGLLDTNQTTGLTNTTRNSGGVLGRHTFFSRSGTIVPCAYSFSQPSASVPASGGSGSFVVTNTAGTNCSWTAQSSNPAWLTTSSSSSTGSGTVNYTAQPNNTTSSRSATINVGGQLFTVTQNAPLVTYAISGRVTSNGNPMNGVTITLSGPTPRTTITDYNGNYQIADLAPAAYTITPSLSGAAFGPASRSITITNANIIDQNFTLAPCTYSLPLSSPTSILPAEMTPGGFSVNAIGTCNWIATSNVPWIVIANEGTGTGNQTVNYVVQHNYNAAVRSGTIAVNGQLFTITQAGFQSSSNNSDDKLPPCEVISLSSSSSGLNRLVIPHIGTNTATLAVNVSDSNCQWTANKNVPWININSNIRTGNVQEAFTVEPLTGGQPPRKGLITVLGKQFAVIQTPPQLSDCNFTLSSPTNHPGVGGGGGSFSINVNPLCFWIADSFDGPWLKTNGVSDGFGPKEQGYTALGNPGLEARTGTIIVGDKAVHINQGAGAAANCSYSLSSFGQTFPRDVGSGNFTVSAGAGCTWTATRDANASWITITGGTGPGNGTVSFTMTANPEPGERSGTITVNNRIFTVRQAGVQQTCSFSISPGFQSIPHTGATGNIQVTAANAGCPWTASSNASWITIIGGANGTGPVSFVAQTNNTLAERTGTITVAGQVFTITQEAGTSSLRTAFDFDGDRKADVSVFRPSNGTWYFWNSTAGFSAAGFGIASDKLVPADYDGDGKTDIAVWRETTPTHAYYYIMLSSTNTFIFEQFGTTGDVPLTGDWNGDGKADLSVYRNGAQSYFFHRQVGITGFSFNAIAWGTSGDKPVIGDYDGDGKTDAAVYRNGMWYISRSSDNQFQAIQFGISTDKVVPGDYDGDGKTDAAVFRNGTWYIWRSALGFTGLVFGLGTDLPVPADYDGDGKTDVAVYRNGIWYMQRSTAGFTGVGFGVASDKPAPNAFVP